MLQGLQVHGVGHGPVDAHGSAVDGVSVFLGNADAAKVLGGCLDGRESGPGCPSGTGFVGGC